MFGFAKKIGMTRVFLDGVATPVTALQLGDNTVLQRKTQEKDGYNAIQIGAFASKKQSPASVSGHIKKHAKASEAQKFAIIGEFHQDLAEDKDTVVIADIEEGKYVDIAGTTKGRGYQGVVKRHGFAGLPASHGHDHMRHPGSIGSRWPQRTMPGKKMAGHMGSETVTVKNVKVVGIDAENNLFFVAGSVPGANGKIVKFSQAKNKKQ